MAKKTCPGRLCEKGKEGAGIREAGVKKRDAVRGVRMGRFYRRRGKFGEVRSYWRLLQCVIKVPAYNH